MYEAIFHYIDENKNVVIPYKEYEKEQRKITQNAFERGRIQGLIEALQLLQEAPLSTKEQILKEAIRKQGEKGNETIEKN